MMVLGFNLEGRQYEGCGPTSEGVTSPWGVAVVTVGSPPPPPLSGGIWIVLWNTDPRQSKGLIRLVHWMSMIKVE